MFACLNLQQYVLKDVIPTMEPVLHPTIASVQQDGLVVAARLVFPLCFPFIYPLFSSP